VLGGDIKNWPKDPEERLSSVQTSDTKKTKIRLSRTAADFCMDANHGDCWHRPVGEFPGPETLHLHHMVDL